VSIDDADAALEIIDAGRQRVLARLQEAVADQMRLHGELDELDPATLDDLLAQGVGDAGASLWRISLAEGAADHFGIPVSDALHHPVIDAAEQLIGLPEEQPGPVEPETSWAEPAPAPSEPDPWTAPEPDAEPELYIPPGYEDDLAAAAASDPEPAPDLWGAEPDPEPDPDPVWAEPEPAPQPFVAEPEPEPVWAEPEPVAQPFIPEPTPEPVTTPMGSAPGPPASVSPAAIAVPQALRIAAIHTSGIESLQAGDEDIELRLSEAGLDVIKRSSGIAIGRLDWGEITALEVQEPGKRGRRRRKSRNRSLQVDTRGGQAAFELVGISDEETAEHLEPLLARLRVSGALASTA
jgi:hypothetical protein